MHYSFLLLAHYPWFMVKDQIVFIAGQFSTFQKSSRLNEYQIVRIRKDGSVTWHQIPWLKNHETRIISIYIYLFVNQFELFCKATIKCLLFWSMIIYIFVESVDLGPAKRDNILCSDGETTLAYNVREQMLICRHSTNIQNGLMCHLNKFLYFTILIRWNCAALEAYEFHFPHLNYETHLYS